MPKIVAFGEIMLRISPQTGYRLFQSDTARTCFGGSEANVAALCAVLGVSSSFVSKVPDNPAGAAALASLSKLGVDVSGVIRDDGRLGLYYYEKGAGQRPALCVYDRAGSSFSNLSYEELDVERIFKDADLFHLSGITPALSGKMPDVCEKLCAEAAKRGIAVSFDLNYRTKLWSEEECAAEVGRLLPYINVFISNLYQANDVLKLGADTGSEEKACIDASREIMKRYGTGIVALTVRKTYSADKNGFYGMIYDGENAFFSRKYETEIIDRVGSGDAFDGALLASLLKRRENKAAVEYAAAAAVLKHSIEGDTAYLTDADISALVSGGDGRVRR